VKINFGLMVWALKNDLNSYKNSITSINRFMIDHSDIFKGLNDAQKQAVTTIQGPVLVVAGPGTGKTLTIVRRIAYLIHEGVKPENILAMTFTNRAAREMQERVTALLGIGARGIFIGTFHLLGLRIISDHRDSDFTILNRDEQIGLLKEIVQGSVKKARQACERISRMKNFLKDGAAPLEGDKAESQEFNVIYESYQAALKRQNAVDFDDLIKTPVELLEDGGRAHIYKEKFQHIIVDEYQDINPAQYRLLRLLLNSSHNLCAVGDPDQAIYAFRGADIGNFLNFEQDFPRAARITLNSNYRSTGIIVNASDSVIRNNRKRIDKTLSAVKAQGGRVTVLSLSDERVEGEQIVREIEARMGGTSHDQMRRNKETRDYADCSYRFSDFAVIFRTNAQAMALEEAFSASGIPFQVIGRKSSVQSREIEETTAFLQSFIHPGEDAASQEAGGRESKLLTSADYFDPRADAVALMTMHMAKGLEFRVVFVAGCEDGLVPCTIMKDGVDIEEERRLFYVGMTRAKDELFLLHARSRFLYGQRHAALPAPFLAEIPDSLAERSIIPVTEKKEKTKDRQMGLF
jgi:DNA helicase II / ATP-dependent DNA helicase PcrA